MAATGETTALAHINTATPAHVATKAAVENCERNRLCKNVRVACPVARQRSAIDMVSADEAAAPAIQVLRKMKFPPMAAPEIQKVSTERTIGQIWCQRNRVGSEGTAAFSRPGVAGKQHPAMLNAQRRPRWIPVSVIIQQQSFPDEGHGIA
jgi:hypothetical protein